MKEERSHEIKKNINKNKRSPRLIETFKCGPKHITVRTIMKSYASRQHVVGMYIYVRIGVYRKSLYY